MVGPGRNQCGICLKFFRDNYKLRRHAVVHTKEKPYACRLCGKGFTQLESLRGHMTKLHQQ